MKLRQAKKIWTMPIGRESSPCGAFRNLAIYRFAACRETTRVKAFTRLRKAGLGPWRD